MKLGKLIYYLLALIIGFGCFVAFLFIIFNWGPGFLGQDNKPVAIAVGILAVVVFIVFNIIGWVIDKEMALMGLLFIAFSATVSGVLVFFR
ncbi:MAG: hypothetical protein K0R57_3957 [Paenibacillaceae bacterium]|jgi:hypothetical protein|nr:hypothetical protein [Paenibacillaceae bacterium]